MVEVYLGPFIKLWEILSQSQTKIHFMIFDKNSQKLKQQLSKKANVLYNFNMY